MKKKEKVSEKIEKIKRVSSRIKIVRELCETVFDEFEMPKSGFHSRSMPSVSIDELAPWQNLVEDDRVFENLYRAIKVSFAMGYVVGQALDVPDIDTTPVLDFLRERKSLLYLPHKKAV